MGNGEREERWRRGVDVGIGVAALGNGSAGARAVITC